LDMRFGSSVLSRPSLHAPFHPKNEVRRNLPLRTAIQLPIADYDKPGILCIIHCPVRIKEFRVSPACLRNARNCTCHERILPRTGLTWTCSPSAEHTLVVTASDVQFTSIWGWERALGPAD